MNSITRTMSSAFIPLIVGAALVGLATLFMIKPTLVSETSSLPSIERASVGFGMVEIGQSSPIIPLQNSQ